MKNVFILWFLTFTLSVSAQNQTITLASNIWPPFTDHSSKQSISYQIVQEALERGAVNTTLQITTFDKVLEGIQSHEFSGSAALWKTADRETYMIFSKSYLQNQLMLVSLKGNPVDNITLTELEGKTIGVIKEFAYSDSIIKHANINFEYSKTNQFNVERLFMGKIDYMLVDNLVLNYMLTYDLANIKDTIAVSSVPFDTKELYFAIHKDVPNAKEIVNNFNSQLQTMVTDGTIHNILGMQWIQADVNNDGIPELVLNGNEAGVQAPDNAYQLFHDPKTRGQQNGYYINGQYYQTWNDVPKNLKTTPKNQSAPESYNPGIRINF